MSIGIDTEITIKNTIQSYIDNNYPGIEVMLFRFNSRKEYENLTGSYYWRNGYVIEYHGKGQKQQGIMFDTSLIIFSELGEKFLINGIENHARLCINLLLEKIEIELAIKLLSNKIEKDKI